MNLLRWKGISVNSGKHKGFSAKLQSQAGFDLVDSGRVDLDPLDLDLTADAVCGQRGRRD
jgi:hypothetical protein